MRRVGSSVTRATSAAAPLSASSSVAGVRHQGWGSALWSQRQRVPYSATASGPAYPEVTAAEAQERLHEYDAVLDVREPDEWADGGIGSPKKVPLGRVMRDINTEELQSLKGKKVLVYCRSGGRSSVACGVLAKAGIQPTNLAGGMRGWQEASKATPKQ